MTTNDPVTAGQAIVNGLKKAGIDFVATLPDEKMLEVIRAVERDEQLKHVPLCREEEGIGICAGAYLAGKKTAIIMQNAGFLNSCNALTTTSLQLQIPILMLIYYAGDIGDRGFTTLGSVTEPVLQAMGFRSYVLRKPDEIDETLARRAGSRRRFEKAGGGAPHQTRTRSQIMQRYDYLKAISSRCPGRASRVHRLGLARMVGGAPERRQSQDAHPGSGIIDRCRFSHRPAAPQSDRH